MNSATAKNFSLIVESDFEKASRAAADLIVSALRTKPDLLVCCATGASPTRTYELLADEHRRNSSLFQNIRILKLDEWGGLAMDDPGSCEAYLRKHVLGPLAISKDRYVGFESN